MDEATRAWLALLRTRMNPAALIRLVEARGDARRALSAGPSAWRAAGAGERSVATLRDGQVDIEADLRWLRAAPRRHLLAWDHPDYPALLRRVPSPPAALFVEGDPDALWRPQIALVGSRRASATGCDNAAAFARAFARDGLAVTSGLASGVDAAAHRGALAVGGATVAVTGTGLDVNFPRGNAALQAEIAARGTLVSEYPPGTAPHRAHFPARNRIIAGLALGVLVVEAAERSGALITARLAAEAGREAFAIPGSIHNPMARGCHRLIRQGAALVEHPGEVVDALAGTARELADALRARLAGDAPAGAAAAPSPPPSRDPKRAQLLAALDFDPMTLDTLAARTGLTVQDASAILLSMEMEGLVACEHGRYLRRSPGPASRTQTGAPLPRPSAPLRGAGRG